MTRTDRCVLLAAIASVALLFVLEPLARERGQAGRVEIEVGGRVARRLTLLPEGQERTVEVTLPRGRAILSLEQGGVLILPMPRALCPRGICSHSGLIREPGGTLVCVPNRLIVRIPGGQAVVDAVAR